MISVFNWNHFSDAINDYGKQMASYRVLLFAHFGFSFFCQVYILIAYLVMIYLKYQSTLKLDDEIHKKMLERAHRKMEKQRQKEAND